MKVYLPQYDNDESYEDYHEWLSDNIYYTEEKAIKEITNLGFRLNEDKSKYSRFNIYSLHKKRTGFCSSNAKIIELDLL